MSGILSAFMTDLTNVIIFIDSTIKDSIVQLATSTFYGKFDSPGFAVKGAGFGGTYHGNFKRTENFRGVNLVDCVRIKHLLEPHSCPI
jgi:hypothetical protein